MMAGYDSRNTGTYYRSLDTMIGGGRHPGDAYNVFLGELDEYDQVTGRDGYSDQEIMVQELLDALNGRLRAVGLHATYSGDVYRNADAEPDDDDVKDAIAAFWDEDFADIVQRHDRSGLVDSAERLLEDYDLSHGNSEVILQDRDLYVTVEAPNHATISVNTPVMESDEETIGNLKTEMARSMGDFDADERFNEYWSKDFAEHNGFTPSGFLTMLQKDERHFHDTAQRLAGDVTGAVDPADPTNIAMSGMDAPGLTL